MELTTLVRASVTGMTLVQNPVLSTPVTLTAANSTPVTSTAAQSTAAKSIPVLLIDLLITQPSDGCHLRAFNSCAIMARSTPVQSGLCHSIPVPSTAVDLCACQFTEGKSFAVLSSTVLAITANSKFTHIISNKGALI